MGSPVEEPEVWALPEYDLEEVYDEQISPLMLQIIAICKAHNMPMLATFCYKNENRAGEDSDPMLCTSTLLFPDVTPVSMRKALSVVKGGGSNMSFAITTTRQ